MAQMKTPGVYITEKDAFGNNVVEVATAVPAFIGYTERASNGSKSLKNKPVRITSLAEFIQFFGQAPSYKFTITTNDSADQQPIISLNTEEYNLFNSMRLFYTNGGGPCYIISVGNYSDNINVQALKEQGLTPLLKETEPTMVVIPEAVSLKDETACASLQNAVLAHCEKMGGRVGILDIYNGFKDINDADGDVISNFRNGLRANNFSYGTAYYPWLHTNIVQSDELGLQNIDNASLSTLKTLIEVELNLATPEDNPNTQKIKKVLDEMLCINDKDYAGSSIETLNKILTHISHTYTEVLAKIQEKLNLLPPASAMAGIYTLVDNTRGVWKAPANVSLSAVLKPSVNISHDQQENLNMPISGKSVNAIRLFQGQGVLVWGARTLDTDSQDWRYINVRRTMIMLEQSIKIACEAYVFEPNDAGTWTTMKGMIDNFLNNQWKAGALVGATPEDAYSVSIGLGSTMTANDILDGILRITVLLALSRPAEFIVITFQQQMQKS